MKLIAASYSYLCGIVLLRVNIHVILVTNVNIFRLFKCTYISNMLYEYALNEAG